MSTTETNVNPKLRALAEAGTGPWLDLLWHGWSPRTHSRE